MTDVVLGRTYHDSRLAKTSYASIYPEVGRAKALSCFEPHAVLGLTIDTVYVLPGARSTSSPSARLAFRLLEGRYQKRVDLRSLVCRCLSKCNEGDDAPGCPGDDGTWDHCSGCGHRRDSSRPAEEVSR